MSRFVQSNVPANVDSVFALLKLVNDPDEFKNKMAQMQAFEKKLDEKIVLAGIAEEIVHLRASTHELHEAAKRQLAQSGLQIAQLQEQAQKESQAAVARAMAIRDEHAAKGQEMLSNAQAAAKKILLEHEAVCLKKSEELSRRVDLLTKSENDLANRVRDCAKQAEIHAQREQAMLAKESALEARLKACQDRENTLVRIESEFATTAMRFHTAFNELLGRFR